MNATHESIQALRQVWSTLSPAEQAQKFSALSSRKAKNFFHRLTPLEQSQLLMELSPLDRRRWFLTLAPDDAADVIQESPLLMRRELLDMLDVRTRREVFHLLHYAEDVAGGIMSPRFARVRPEASVEEALIALRMQALNQTETIYYAYVVDREERLCGVISIRELFSARSHIKVADLMHTEVVSVPEDADREAVAKVIAHHDLLAVPVVDEQGRMKGIITVDDIVDVLTREATEDIQKLGGSRALDMPFLQTGFKAMVGKRVGWLALLFLGAMLTAGAMSQFEEQLAEVVALTLFVPLIISSGGNAGSQVSTLVIRAIALGEVRPQDWWRVALREIRAGLALGGILASLGLIVLFLASFFWGGDSHSTALLALTVGLSIIGVVTTGTLVGSLLPFVLHALDFDPATASAPLVSTLVDLLGLVLYLSIARLVFSNLLI
ncbi:magnesium transporter [Nitrosococcus halophilus Nc 4]|uniref:Magnesium transporter MgtE n=1 Tax=Nitrosococcus halophilus (strain Nc4) TaxID=472759 RepID=D5BY08_NITHN|nr:magnesium transporter [Nitrosococcus halophilus]ADE15919.1 magnesium transporter [Nitrosococcus halophilus Nc 4]